jgi:ferric iron reductase protein FhuF
MVSEATMTIIKMLETLPEHAQDRVVEHLREYIEDLRDEALWNNSFSRTQAKLVAAAQQVRNEIAEGKATSLVMSKR